MINNYIDHEFIPCSRLLDRRFCWCDLAAQAQFERGIVQPFYVIEIAVAPWDAKDGRNASLLKVRNMESLHIYQLKC